VKAKDLKEGMCIEVDGFCVMVTGVDHTGGRVRITWRQPDEHGNPDEGSEEGEILASPDAEIELCECPEKVDD